MLEQAMRLFRSDVAIDLGSAVTRVLVRGQGLVFEEPSLVLTKTHNQKEKITAFGNEAKQFLGRTPASMKIHQPLCPLENQQQHLAKLLGKHALDMALGSSGLFKPKILMLLPHGLSPEQRKLYLDILYFLGNRDSIYVDSLFCAGLGAHLPVNEPIGSLILQVGHDTSQVGLLTMSGLACANRSNVAGSHMNHTITQWLHEQYQHRIGYISASFLKEAIGEADQPDAERRSKITCRDSISGAAKEVALSSVDICPPIQQSLLLISNMVKRTISKVSPELAADIVERGLMLCGGSANIYGIDDFFAQQLNIPVFVCEQPHLTSIQGAGALLEDNNLLDWIGESK